MQAHRIIGLAVVLCFLAVAAYAADPTGKWTAQVPGRDGTMREMTFTFKVDGEKLTGTIGSARGEMEISDGKVSGDEISFSVTMGKAKIQYRGKVGETEIKFTQQREGGQPREFTAKKAS